MRQHSTTYSKKIHPLTWEASKEKFQKLYDDFTKEYSGKSYPLNWIERSKLKTNLNREHSIMVIELDYLSQMLNSEVSSKLNKLKEFSKYNSDDIMNNTLSKFTDFLTKKTIFLLDQAIKFNDGELALMVVNFYTEISKNQNNIDKTYQYIFKEAARSSSTRVMEVVFRKSELIQQRLSSKEFIIETIKDLSSSQLEKIEFYLKGKVDKNLRELIKVERNTTPNFTEKLTRRTQSLIELK